MSKYLAEVRPNRKEGIVTALKDKDLIVKNGVNDNYWLEMYQNVARAKVNRAQTKQLMFVYSKVKIGARSERP